MEMSQLHALVAAAETGSFSAAAQRLGYSQSAVSQLIRRLERQLGVDLFDRPGGPRPARLTAEGKVMAGHARGVLDRLRIAETDLSALRTGKSGSLRVGAMQSIATKIIPWVLRRFQEESPEVAVILEETNEPRALMQAVLSGELHIALMALNEPVDNTFHVSHLLDDPFVFLTSKTSPQARQAEVTLAEISLLPLVGVQEPTLDAALTAALRTDGRTAPTFAIRSNDNPTIHALVAAGLGHAILPKLAVDENDDRVDVVTIAPAMAPRRITALWHADRVVAPAAQRFLAQAKLVCDGI
jgi:DNA-binding transcriptional LysR family regulator